MSAVARAAEFKLVVLGDAGVGKSALVIQLTQARFNEEYEPTIEDSYRKQLAIDGEVCLLDIHDYSPREEYSSMLNHFIHTGQGFLCVYSLTSRQSFEEALAFRERILRVKDADAVPMVLVGNKLDLEAAREVSKTEGDAWFSKWTVPFFETSAKTGLNVHEVFVEGVRQINQARSKMTMKKERHGKCSIL